MKKATKIILIISAILGALGIGLLVAGLYQGGIEALDYLSEEGHVPLEETEEEETPENEELDSEYGVEEWSFAELDSIHTISVDSEYSTIHIISSDEVDEIQVFGQKRTENVMITAKLEDGILSVSEGKVYEMPPEQNKDNSYIRITIPSHYAIKHIAIESDAGLVSYNVGNVCEKFECEIKAGSFGAEQIYCKYGDISVDAGSIEAKHCYIGEANINCNTGMIKLKDISLESKMNVNCDVGKVDLELKGTEMDYGFNLSNSLGTVKVGDMELDEETGWYNGYNDAEKKVDIFCDLGSVKIDFIQE